MTDLAGAGLPPGGFRGSLWVLLAALVELCLVVVHPFLTPLLWAAIVAYTSWPPYRQARRFCGSRDAVAAFLMTALVSLVLVVPLIWLVMLLTDEVARAYQGFLG